MATSFKMLSYHPPYKPSFQPKCIVFLWLMMWGCFCVPVTQGRYRCMLKDFIRLGNSCYFLSAEIASWQEAHFRCRDRGSQLAVLASHYEDSTLRSYLERPEFAQLGRWIGGMWASDKWIWAAQGTEIESEKSFVNEQSYKLGETDQWMCLHMDPRSRYHWSNENCMRQFHYICEAPLAKETTPSVNDASPAEGGDPTTLSSPTDISTSTMATSATEIISSSEQTDADDYDHDIDDVAESINSDTNVNSDTIQDSSITLAVSGTTQD